MSTIKKASSFENARLEMLGCMCMGAKIALFYGLYVLKAVRITAKMLPATMGGELVSRVEKKTGCDSCRGRRLVNTGRR